MKKKQLILNIGANFVSVMVSLIISFFLTPYIIQSIGKEAYAFVPISNNFTSYMAVLTLALTSMTGRFVTLKTHKNDINAANDYYSTSFYSNLVIALFWSLICFAVVIFLNRLINIPPEIFDDVRLLFIFMFIAFIVNLATTSFSVAAYCMNRLDVNSIINIVGSIMRIAVIFVLFSFFRARVYYIGLSVLAFMLILGSLNMITSRKIMPTLKISLKRVKMKIVWELLSSGIWNSFIQLSNVLLTGLDLVIANLILGPSASGVLAIAKTAPMALQSLIAVVPSAFSPYLTILYARDDRNLFISELLYTLKFTSIITGIPIAAYIALSSSFFGLWVPSVAGNELTALSLLTMISMIASFCIMPLFHIFTITNRLKWPSAAIFVTGLLNIIIVLTVLKTTNLGLYAIAGISSFLEIFRCLIFVPRYAAHCIHESPSMLYRPIVKGLAYMAILIATFTGITLIVPPTSWLTLLVLGSIMVAVGLLIGVMFMLNSLEKEKLRTMVTTMTNKLKKS